VLENNQIEPESASLTRREAEVLAFAARTAGQILKNVSGIKPHKSAMLASPEAHSIQPAKGPAANKAYAREILLGPEIITITPEKSKTMPTVIAKSRRYSVESIAIGFQRGP